uniref:C-type lectin domain family 4 member E-like isoform X4 n=1 Tax=Scatophagus argus TaxID=75038 RepID=UPI001ED8415B|nr:C-type lectin domain family 4 member E-like isoform X4 [Scatophagus argus]
MCTHTQTREAAGGDDQTDCRLYSGVTVRRMDMGHYVNSPACEGTSHPDERENCHSGPSKVLWVVGVSFGLLCIMQSVLNVALRLHETGFWNRSDLICNVTLLEKELQANNDFLTRDNVMLKNKLRLLRHETERMSARLLEIEQKLQSCPLGWTPVMSSCYQLSTGTKDWMYASEDCVAKGAYLVILDSESEEQVLHTLGSSVMWIGLKAQQVNGRKLWTWVDSSPLTDPGRIQLQPDDRQLYCAYSQQSSNGLVTWVQASCGDAHLWKDLGVRRTTLSP